MIYEDIRVQTISSSGLFVFGGATLYYQLSKLDPEGFWVAGAVALVLLGLYAIFFRFRGQKVFGWGDLILGPLCGLWLQIHEVPLYFLATGIFALLISLLWHFKWGLKTFPFAPALLLGLGVVFLKRCF